MSVTYVQTARYQYSEGKMSDKEFSKAALKLSQSGLYLCSSSHYGNSQPEVTYGLVDDTTTSHEWHVTIDDKPAITTTYACDARAWKEQLTENGFDCDYSKETTQSVKQVWGQPRGSSMYISDDVAIVLGHTNFTKVSKSYDFLHLLYGEDVSMTPSLSNSSDGLILRFETTWTTAKVARKQAIEENMVALPLYDMALIQSLVEDAIGTTTPVDIDCNFRCQTLSTSQCTPDIIAMRKEASVNARAFSKALADDAINATQEEE